MEEIVIQPFPDKPNLIVTLKAPQQLTEKELKDAQSELVRAYLTCYARWRPYPGFDEIKRELSPRFAKMLYYIQE